ncbi:vWA domain-containing protein [Cellulomonas composti]|uniref:VWA-like domain-containing protein n=1 Tax=Cellulomonas composti TaxID=266130 RepID=A0A511JED9_9CELL|nr:VWA-like domain-containing protein [Cellulomonas composti]GEL96354.1 hypothetical protein CCO02nite_30120 [Cellulomonas composti]
MAAQTSADRIAAAKLWAISTGSGAANLPYLAHALYALVLVESDDVDRVSADEHWRVYVNPAWVATIEVPELGRELIHLTWHLLLDHASRAAGMGVDGTTAAAWHAAAELTVAETLGADLTPAPTAREAAAARGGRLRNARAGRAVEEHYALLSGLPAAARGTPRPEPVRVPGCWCGSCCDGVARTSELPANADVGAVGRVDADLVRHHVAIEFQQATGVGTHAGEAGRWAKEILEPTIPWETLLARAVRRAVGWTSGRHEQTWARPSRRTSSSPGVLLPGWRRPVPRVAMVVDTSASIDDRLLGRALGEVDGALTGIGVPGTAVTVLACDTAVGPVRRVRRASEAALVGGGGTDLRVGIQAAAAARPRPDLVCVLTDGHTPWPAAAPPGVAVVVAMLGRAGEQLPPTPRWALRVECRLPD